MIDVSNKPFWKRKPRNIRSREVFSTSGTERFPTFDTFASSTFHEFNFYVDSSNFLIWLYGENEDDDLTSTIKTLVFRASDGKIYTFDENATYDIEDPSIIAQLIDIFSKEGIVDVLVKTGDDFDPQYRFMLDANGFLEYMQKRQQNQ